MPNDQNPTAAETPTIDEKSSTSELRQASEELKKKIATLKGRLDNPGYAAKAPAHLVEQTRAELAKAEEELKKLG